MHACIVAMNVGSVVSYLLILTDTVSGVAGAVAQQPLLAGLGAIRADVCMAPSHLPSGLQPAGCKSAHDTCPPPVNLDMLLLLCRGHLLQAQMRLFLSTLALLPHFRRHCDPPRSRAQPQHHAGALHLCRLPPRGAAGCVPATYCRCGSRLCCCLLAAKSFIFIVFPFAVKSGQLLNAVNNVSMAFLLLFCGVIALLPFSPTPGSGAPDAAIACSMGWLALSGVERGSTMLPSHVPCLWACPSAC